MKLHTELESLLAKITEGKVGNAEPWIGADVVICNELPDLSGEGFYPDPRFVTTEHVPEMSWIFEQLRDVFCEEDGYGYWKEEFFGRLGNVINEQCNYDPQITANDLLYSVITEAIVMATEIQENGGIESLPLTWGNIVSDDFRENQRSKQDALIEKEGIRIPIEVRFLAAVFGVDPVDILAVGPENEFGWMRDNFNEFLKPLDEKSRKMLDLRWGFGSEDGPRTLAEVAQKLHITPERVRLIEARAMSQLRLPKGMKSFDQFFDDL